MGQVRSAVCFSVPCDLKASAERLANPANSLYMRTFLRSLRRKLDEKLGRFPGIFCSERIEQIKSFFQFDEHVTAPLHGYTSAQDYYSSCSGKGFIPAIAIPTLVVNAKDDPMLGEECFPLTEAGNSETVFLELPDHGGHAGFCSGSASGVFWSEKRAAEFIQQHSKP
jgi:predicted alpha/beta-fold hydrolase